MSKNLFKWHQVIILGNLSNLSIFVFAPSSLGLSLVEDFQIMFVLKFIPVMN